MHYNEGALWAHPPPKARDHVISKILLKSAHKLSQ